ncbi:MAG: hypothetical protein ACLFPE_10990 [Bacteroidales bacterium]
MSRDKLEKFIHDHRDEFDEFEPDPALFAGVKTRPPVVNMVRWNSVLWKAAAVVAIFVGSYFFHDWMSQYPHRQQTATVSQSDESSEIVRVLIEAEAYYSAQIETRREEFYHLAEGNIRLKKEIDYELVELDSIYADLKRDLKDNAANQAVIEAMIQNYRVKLDILENVLNQLQQARDRKQKKEEANEVEL